MFNSLKLFECGRDKEKNTYILIILNYIKNSDEYHEHKVTCISEVLTSVFPSNGRVA